MQKHIHLYVDSLREFSTECPEGPRLNIQHFKIGDSPQFSQFPFHCEQSVAIFYNDAMQELFSFPFLFHSFLWD